MPESVLTENLVCPAATSESEAEVCEDVRQRSRIVLSVEEAQGIADILANPQPPTEDLKRACREYQSFANAHPGSGW